MADKPAPDAPHDPSEAFTAASAHVHEAYAAFVTVGFTEGQALYLAACLLIAGIKGAP